MKRLGLPGVHVQTMSINGPAHAAFRRMGFRLMEQHPVPAFDRDGQAVEGQTWVREL